jgi:hypothetical protein
VLVVAAYAGLGAVAFWPLSMSTHLLGAEADFQQSVWFLAWVPHALGHGLNPLFSHAVFVPSGMNLAQNTASPLLGLVTGALAPVLGPLVRANLLFVLGMPVSTTAAYAVLRRWDVWRPAAALGGLLYGFSPYMVGQSLGHVELLWVPIPPLLALTVASIVQRRGSARRLGLQLGLLVTAQYLISPEVLATVAITFLIVVAYLVVREPATAPELARTVWAPVAIAAAVSAALLAYPIWLLVAGPQHYGHPTWPLKNPYHNDLLSFVAPGPLQRVSLGMRSLGTRLDARSGATEAGGYVGAPLLVLTGLLAWRSRARLRTQLAVTVLLGTAVLTLGPTLALNGHLTGIPLPFAVLDHIPLLDSILPARITFEVGAAVAALLAFGLDDLHRDQVGRSPGRTARQRGWRRSAVVAGAALVVVATQLPTWPRERPYLAPRADPLPAALRRSIPPGDPVALAYPYASATAAAPMYWQAEDGFRFRLLGGYGYDANGLVRAPLRPAGLQRFLAAQEGLGTVYGRPPAGRAQLISDTLATLDRYRVRVVIVDRRASGAPAVIQLFTETLGPPEGVRGSVSWWRVTLNG